MYRRRVRATVVGGLLFMLTTGLQGRQDKQEVERRYVQFQDVRLSDPFWAPRLEMNRRVTLDWNLSQCERTGRLNNFKRAAAGERGTYEGLLFNDSDVYKAIEGAAYLLATERDALLESRIDALIDQIQAAQDKDGYLNTYYLLEKDRSQRWTREEHDHELYCAGHLIEAGIAYHEATGKSKLLEVAIRFADLIEKTFGPGPGQRAEVPGHQEIEIALVRLGRFTQDAGYINLAKYFLEERGRKDRRPLYGPYAQDEMPVADLKSAAGHAVRAAYMYTAMADIALATGESAYGPALDRLWNDVAGSKLYVTGGIGARAAGEAFGDPFELPNNEAYSETCASIANAMWNSRMFLLTGDAKFLDVLETALYNAIPAGVGLGGDRFFYVNPLASDGGSGRQPWYDCACCPPNILRFLPQIPGLVYAVSGNDSIYVNLFMQNSADVRLGADFVQLDMRTDYPWGEEVRLTVKPRSPREFAVHIRVPQRHNGGGWPGGLYQPVNDLDNQPIMVRVNGEVVSYRNADGFAVVRRSWQPGDVIEFALPMEVTLFRAHPEVKACENRVAIVRGPVVYCLEGPDHGGHVRNLWIPTTPDNRVAILPMERDSLGTFLPFEVGGLAREQKAGESAPTDVPTVLRPIPYCAWANRGPSEMAVWVPMTPTLARILPPPTIASKSRVSVSHCYSMDTPLGANDQIDPSSSGDHSVQRLTFWPRKGTTEWVQYDFEKQTRVSQIAVYWFDDSGRGECRTPAAYRVLLSEDGRTWRPVDNPRGLGTATDEFNVTTFDEVNASAIRLEIDLHAGFSGGVLEWKVR